MNDKIAENIDINMAAVAEFCRRWHISEMALFGSVLRDDFTQDSLNQYPASHVRINQEELTRMPDSNAKNRDSHNPRVLRSLHTNYR